MRRPIRLIGTLVGGLALLTWGAWAIVQGTMRAWFERDVALRSGLVVNGARQALVQAWHDPGALSSVLTDISRDERIMGAAACSSELVPVAKTRDFPPFSCRANAAAGHAFATDLPGGEVHFSAVPVDTEAGRLGTVVLVHDLSFVARRDRTTRNFLLLAFGLLAAAASGLTLAATRHAWKSWSRQLRQQLRGESARPEFNPVLRDVRGLVDRILSEREAELEAGQWNPERLKQTLRRHLHGERVVVMANREPYIHQRTEDGGIRVQRPASGLVTALEPVMRACSGVWVAHGSGSADRAAVDAADRVKVPPGDESYVIRRVWLSDSEERGYYYGFSNEGLWPLCHIAHTRPTFRADDFAEYQNVNRKFVEAVCQEVDSDDPIILVQDYHFGLAPRMIRERLPRATVITFWHIPWPNSERFGICPWRHELLDGLLGSSILGFHTRADCNNFMESVDRYLEARLDREHAAIVRKGGRTLVRPYPISVQWPSQWSAGAPSVERCRSALFAELRLGPDAVLGIGVDRLDYTKGIEERLEAVELLLERHPEYRGRFSFLQVAAPSRTAIERYQRLNDAVEGLAARINARFGTTEYSPIILLRAHHDPEEVFRFYRAANVCYVSSLHDGMNLVAKEFVAAREDERGVLVLSQFTGAARDLPEALIVNPYDLEQAASALHMALSMPESEQGDRMRSMRGFLAEFNVHRWAGRMLVDAARLRRRERLRLGFELTEDAG